MTENLHQSIMYFYQFANKFTEIGLNNTVKILKSKFASTEAKDDVKKKV